MSTRQPSEQEGKSKIQTEISKERRPALLWDVKATRAAVKATAPNPPKAMRSNQTNRECIRRMSFMSISSDVSMFEAEQRDERAMDIFFADFEDDEIKGCTIDWISDNNDETLGNMLDRMMDTL